MNTPSTIIAQPVLPLRASFCALGLVAMSAFLASPVRADIAYADKPLFWASGVKPNVALVIDTSGSMGTRDTGAAYPYVSTCDGTTVTDSSPISFNAGAAGTTTPVNKNTNYEKITKTGHGFNTGDPTTYISTGPIGGLTSGSTYYVAVLTTDTFRLATTAALAATCAAAADNTAAVGANCINLTSEGSSGVAQKFTRQITRLEAAKLAACQTVTDNVTNMNIGLYRFANGGTAGQQVNAVGANTAATLNGTIAGGTGIAGFVAQNGTPLSSTMSLVLGDFTGANSPIQYRCQKNYIVFFTDGAPTTGDDKNTPLVFPTLDTAQSTTWKNGSGTSGGSSGSPSWDGFPDPQYTPDGQLVYPWLDDLAQFAYDVDIKTSASAAMTTAKCGFTMTGVAGKDCSNKSWDGTDDSGANAALFKKQNLITYTIGFGPGANSELMRDTPMVDQRSITAAQVNTTNDTITLTGHGLTTGDYALYYKSYSDFVVTAAGDTSTDTLTVSAGNTAGMVTGTPLTYSNSGGTSLAYNVLTTPAVPAATCGGIGGLTSGSTYYVVGGTSNTFQLATSVSGTAINLTSKGTTNAILGFSRAAVTNAAVSVTSNTSGATPINTATETITSATHGFSTGDLITYTCSGSGCTIGGLTSGNIYYAAVVTTTTFRLANSDANAATCAASGTNCINLSYPTTAGRTETFTRVAASAVNLTTSADAGSNVPVNTTSEVITYIGHGFSNGNRIVYTCSNFAGTPAVYTPTTAGTYYAVAIDATHFKLATSAANATTLPTPVTVDIVNAGNNGQTFSYTSANTGIGGLYAYETDTEPDATPDPVSEPEARGKYYVEVIDPDTIKLHECGDAVVLPTDTLYCSVPLAAAVDLTSAGSGILSTGPGKSYFAKTASELSDALNKAFLAIRADTLSSSGLGTNVNNPSIGTYRAYRATYNTSDWSGGVGAYQITSSGSLSTTPDWSASKVTPLANPLATASRKIFTWDGSNAKTFVWANLTTAQKASMNNDASVLNWILGTDNTSAPAGSRTRANGVLGDIVDSSPIYVGKPAAGYDSTLPASTAALPCGAASTTCTGKETYAAFASATPMRTPVLYVGANDGMLHAFNENNGSELFGFVPNGVYTDWADLNNNAVLDGAEVAVKKFYDVTQNGYGQAASAHQFFVDGSPTVGDAYLSDGNWHTVLLGGLRKGGRSIYALDVTNDLVTNSFSASGSGTSNKFNKPLWEFTDGNSGTMGYTFSEPRIARLSNGVWAAIFGNGYDSAGDKAYLFVVDLETGALIKRITLASPVAGANGLSTVTVRNDDTLGAAKIVYAGDLRGNVWRVDISNSSPGSWASSVTTPFFSATDSVGNPQAITETISVGTNPAGGAMIYVGTGSYISTADKSYTYPGSAVKNDTMYGLWDNDSSVITGRSALVQQTISTALVSGVTARQMTNYTVTYTGSSPQRGWYIDLVVGTNYQGERVVYPSTLYNTLLLFPTVIPSNTDACTGGGESYGMAVDAMTGGQPVQGFDINGDGVFDAAAGFISTVGVLTGVVVMPNGMSIWSGASGTQSMGLPPPPAANVPTKGRMSWRQLQ